MVIYCCLPINIISFKCGDSGKIVLLSDLRQLHVLEKKYIDKQLFNFFKSQISWPRSLNSSLSKKLVNLGVWKKTTFLHGRHDRY